VRKLLVTSALMATTAVSSLSVAGVKNVPYPEVRVRLEPIYNPDVAFTNMRNAIALAITKKELERTVCLDRSDLRLDSTRSACE
jgi:hypothetical protein